MNALLNQQEVSNIAGHVLPRLANVIETGFTNYVRSMAAISASGINVNFKPRTSATMIHNLIQQAAEVEFVNDKQVSVGEFNGIFGVLIAKKLFIRFKKLRPNLETSNVKTDQTEDFDRQQLTLPGFANVTLLTAGYIPDATWTSIRSISLTCKQNDELLWYSDLHGEVSQTSIFSPEVTEEQGVPTVRVRPNSAENTATNAS
jgi:hypothetical protein